MDYNGERRSWLFKFDCWIVKVRSTSTIQYIICVVIIRLIRQCLTLISDEWSDFVIHSTCIFAQNRFITTNYILYIMTNTSACVYIFSQFISFVLNLLNKYHSVVLKNNYYSFFSCDKISYLFICLYIWMISFHDIAHSLIINRIHNAWSLVFVHVYVRFHVCRHTLFGI